MWAQKVAYPGGSANPSIDTRNQDLHHHVAYSAHHYQHHAPSSVTNKAGVTLEIGGQRQFGELEAQSREQSARNGSAKHASQQNNYAKGDFVEVRKGFFQNNNHGHQGSNTQEEDSIALFLNKTQVVQSSKH